MACGSRSPAECKKLSSPPASVKESRTVGDLNKSGGRQHMVLMTAIPVGFSSDQATDIRPSDFILAGLKLFECCHSSCLGVVTGVNII